MNFWLGAVLLGTATLLAGCPKPSTPPSSPPAANHAQPVQYHLNHAQSKLRTLKLWVGAQELDAELAVNATEVATGMMFRTNMTDAEGMLFVFGLPGRREFYMKNCVIPLSAAYIDANGVIDEIVELHPGVLEPVPSRSTNIKYVLEVPRGWFSRFNVPTGTVINTARGPLKQLSGILQ